MNDESTVKAIKGLTLAIWMLTLVLALTTLTPFVWSYLADPWMSSSAESASNKGRGDTRAITEPFNDEFNDFHKWPIEKQIASASAIILTRHSTTGDNLVSTVAEVLKLRENTILHYQVGDLFDRFGQVLRPDTSYGDGQIVFFTGTPAEFVFSTTVHTGRCLGLGDMPIERIKALIAESAVN